MSGQDVDARMMVIDSTGTEHQAKGESDGTMHAKVTSSALPSGAAKESKQDDSYIRKTAVKRKVPYITTLAAALAAAKGIDAFRRGRGQVKSVQEYHAGIR